MEQIITNFKEFIRNNKYLASFCLVGISILSLLKKYFNGGINRYFPSIWCEVLSDIVPLKRSPFRSQISYGNVTGTIF